MIAIGAVAERVCLGPLIIFLFLWSTIVYDPIARWVWNPHGWIHILGGLDFAGGTPVHVTSGFTALAISAYLGPRHEVPLGDIVSPNNISHISLGTVLMWFGWMGFNGGSALSANLRAAQAVLVSNVAASSGGLTWLVLVRVKLLLLLMTIRFVG
jgi:Amt family ammonium transporter